MNITRRAFVGCLALALFQGCSGPASPAPTAHPDQLRAEGIFRQMLDTYLSVGSFVQSGSYEEMTTDVPLNSDAGVPQRTRSHVFRMAFARPDKFFLDLDGKRIVWARDGLVGGNGGPWNSIDEAIQTHGGLSRGVSWIVPSMLLGRAYPWSPAIFDNLSRVGEETVGGVRCHILNLKKLSGGTLLFFIEVDRHLLRKTVERDLFPGGMNEELMSRMSPADREMMRKNPPPPWTAEIKTVYDPKPTPVLDASKFGSVPDSP